MQTPFFNMHSVSHSLVHRGPVISATRTCRWQPYASTSTSTQSHQNWTPNTPPSSLSGSPSICRLPHAPNPVPPPSARSRPSGSRPLGRASSVRDVQKSQYITALVDQAVKSLGEIWHPEDIPAAFTSTSAPRSPIPTQTSSMPNMNPSSFAVAGSSSGVRPSFPHHNTQLPSPVTPSTQPSPAPPRAPQTAAPSLCSLPPTTVPLRSFVLEVLKRSKTSAGVLQTALCYIAAIAHKVPVLAAQEQMGLAGRGEPNMEDFIINGAREDDEDLQRDLASDDASTDVNAEQGFLHNHADTDFLSQSGAMAEDADGCSKTVKVDDDLELLATPDSSFIDTIAPRTSMRVCSTTPQRRVPGRPPGPSAPLPPLPPLPSPLLCPRRTFLAAIILASKFTQDKCFSNKAWARLAGLPAREISRCERALGAALDWRLWVGKLPSSAVAGAGARPPPRTLSRTKTVTDIPSVGCSLALSDRDGVSRSRTLPAHSFGEPSPDQKATPSYQHWHAGSHQNATRPCLEFPSLATSDDGCLPRHCFAGASLHASPSFMPTPGLSYSPASTSSSGPTPMIHMTDSDIPARFPASDAPWGLGGAVSGVSTVAFAVPGNLGVGAHLQKPKALNESDAMPCAYAWTQSSPVPHPPLPRFVL